VRAADFAAGAEVGMITALCQTTRHAVTRHRQCPFGHPGRCWPAGSAATVSRRPATPG
jgi:hypothetical protein